MSAERQTARNLARSVLVDRELRRMEAEVRHIFDDDPDKQKALRNAAQAKITRRQARKRVQREMGER